MAVRCSAAALVLLAASCAGSPVSPSRPAAALVTEAERSGFVRTGRHAEAVQVCDSFAVAYPGRARCERFGTSPEGRALVALVVSDDGVLTPEAAARAGRPVLLIQAGIHAGEIEGKDAGFLALRQALAGEAAAGALRAATVVFVPIFNVDGHERFGPNHRPNQRGPEQMGFRTTAQNLNLNRDYLKVDAPEMAAMLALFNRWDPAVYVDLHTTDGAKFEHDIAVLVAPFAPQAADTSAAAALALAARSLSDALQARLTALGHLPLPFYPELATNDDPASGFAVSDAPVRFSHAYAAARDRLGILVETHSWRTYPERVRATRDLLVALLERAAVDGARWRRAEAAADAADAALGGRDVVLAYRTGAASHPFAFRGYAYERATSPISGTTAVTYDETRPQIWTVPLRDQLEPGLTVAAPRGGYLVTAGFADRIARVLDAHGIRYRRIAAPAAADVDVFRADKVTFAPPYEGRTRAEVTGAWSADRCAVAAGALWIPIAQPRARLILHLLEPTAPDSLVAWGSFNAVFEPKEVMEGYVAEAFARELLARDPATKRAFEERLAADPAFAADPAQRLDFFRRRHPSWDARMGRVPVYRAAAEPRGGVDASLPPDGCRGAGAPPASRQAPKPDDKAPSRIWR